MSTQDKLEKELMQICAGHKGKISHRLGHIDCDFSKNDQTIYLSMGTGVSEGSKPFAKATVGRGEVEIYNLKSISGKTTPNRVQLLSERGDIMTIRADIGIVTFIGDVKGALG